MWKAQLPELGASSRNAPEAFVTLRPIQSSKNEKVIVLFQNKYAHGEQKNETGTGKGELYQIPGT